MPLYIVREDITCMKVDAIVSAGSAWTGGTVPLGGAEGKIHQAAGPRLMEALRRAGGVRTGEATLTKGFELPCKYVIHTAGPVWRGGSYGERMLLRACYMGALRLAGSKGLNSIAFPLIAAGACGYPKEEALKVATATIREFLKTSDMTVHLAVYDRDAFQISRELDERVERCADDAYIEVEYVRRTLTEERWSYRRHRDDGRWEAEPRDGQPFAEGVRWEIPDEDITVGGKNAPVNGNGDAGAPVLNLPSFMRRAGEEELQPRPNLNRPERERLPAHMDAEGGRPVPSLRAETEIRDEAAAPHAPFVMELAAPAMHRPSVPGGRKAGKSLDELVGELDESFSQMLLRLIDERGMKDSDCYHRANVDRKLFSKIRKTPGYAPRKQTAVAFAVSLRLDLEETQALLSKAGLTLSRSNKFDVIVEYFISNGQFDVDVINQALFAYDQVLLGSGMN